MRKLEKPQQSIAMMLDEAQVLEKVTWYPINTTISLVPPLSSTYKVLRRYSDFEILQEYIFLFCRVPIYPIPEKEGVWGYISWNQAAVKTERQ